MQHIKAIINYVFEVLRSDIKSLIYKSELYRSAYTIGMTHNDGQGNVYMKLRFGNKGVNLSSSRHHDFNFNYGDTDFINSIIKQVNKVLETL